MTIQTLVDDLPESSVTVYMLNALDYIVPGEWKNITNFNTMISEVTGEKDLKIMGEIKEKAIALYGDADNGYQRAIWIYNNVDRADAALGAAAMTNKVGSKIPLLGSIFSTLTPKADTAQGIDLAVKTVAELTVFCLLNGVPRTREGINEFVTNLSDYSQANLMRMVGLMSVDGVVPLGPNFATRALEIVNSAGSSGLQENSLFAQVSSIIPGNDVNSKFSFITDNLAQVQGWMSSFAASHNISRDSVTSSLQNYIDISDSKLEYLGAFLDMTTSYYTHTGTQSVARHVIETAAK